MLGIVGIAADFPEVSLEGCFAVRSVLLCDERSLVGSDVHQVSLTSRYRCAYCGETRTSVGLLGGQRRGAVIRISVLDVQARGVPMSLNIYFRVLTVSN